MSANAVRPVATNGLTTAVNATVGSTVGSIAITGDTIVLSVGTVAATAYPIFIMFGSQNQASLLTSTTGFRLPAGAVLRISPPMGCTHIHHLRAVANDSDISVLGCTGGI